MTYRKKLDELTVDDYSSPCEGFVEQDTKVEDIINLMVSKNYRHLPVIENDKAVGIISERDIKTIVNLEGHEELKAEQIMTQTPFTVITGTPLEEVAYEMSSRKVGSALVKDEDEKIVGIFTTSDALNALIEIVRGDLPEE